MTPCNHTALELLPERERTLRCRHCHLTIGAEELQGGFCPECFEISGKKQYEFEEMESEAVARYRCEECGTIIKSADKEARDE